MYMYMNIYMCVYLRVNVYVCMYYLTILLSYVIQAKPLTINTYMFAVAAYFFKHASLLHEIC